MEGDRRQTVEKRGRRGWADVLPGDCYPHPGQDSFPGPVPDSVQAPRRRDGGGPYLPCMWA